jgi:hypothetical protein
MLKRARSRVVVAAVVALLTGIWFIFFVFQSDSGLISVINNSTSDVIDVTLSCSREEWSRGAKKLGPRERHAVSFRPTSNCGVTLSFFRNRLPGVVVVTPGVYVCNGANGTIELIINDDDYDVKTNIKF